MYCPKCACANEDEANYCKGCGNDIRIYTNRYNSSTENTNIACSMCGTVTPSTERYCNKCGTIINATVQISPATQGLKPSNNSIVKPHATGSKSISYVIMSGIAIGTICGIIIILLSLKAEPGSFKNIMRGMVFVASGISLQVVIKNIYNEFTVKHMVAGLFSSAFGFASSIVFVLMFADFFF